MFVMMKCSFCRQSFDFDSSSGLAQIDCPHCGKQNAVEAPASAPKNLTLQHGAPNLSGAQPCPACKAQIARDAVLCVHCGYNLKTGQKTGQESWFAANRGLVLLLGGGLLAVGLGAGYLLWPEAETPPPPFAPAVEPVAAPPAAPAVQPAPAAATNEPAAAAAPAEPVAAPPPPPPAPTAEELAAQKAAAERAAFEAKKAEAERNLRLQLATREPLYKINEPVELRRKNGVLDKGTLTSFSGTGTGRVALVATPTGEIGVPLVLLDNPSRRRIDAEYREAFIQHLLSTKLPPAPGEPPAAPAGNEL